MDAEIEEWAAFANLLSSFSSDAGRIERNAPSKECYVQCENFGAKINY